MRKAFEKNLNDGKECGASFLVTIEGKTVIDLWGVYTDAAKTIIIIREKPCIILKCQNLNY